MSIPSDRIDRLDERRERMRKFTKQPASPPALQAYKRCCVTTVERFEFIKVSETGARIRDCVI